MWRQYYIQIIFKYKKTETKHKYKYKQLKYFEYDIIDNIFDKLSGISNNIPMGTYYCS